MFCRIALLIASLAVAAGARADCDTANRYRFSFASQPVTTLSYGGSNGYTATNGQGQNATITVATTANGLISTTVGGHSLPRIDTDIDNDGGTSRTLVLGGSYLGRTADINGATRVIVLTVTFPVPVRDATIGLSNVDYELLTHRDWIAATGRNGAANYVPAIVTPFGQANGGGPFANGASSLTLGPTGSPVTVTASQAAGTSNSASTSAAGDMTLSFVQPVTSIEIRYGNYPLQLPEVLTGAQLIGVRSIDFCPMPAITATKTETPYVATAGDPARFDAPGNDVVYAVTVTNSGGSPVDAASLQLADLLPPEVSFYNGDIDGAGPIAGNYEFVPGASGLTLPAANLAYSNNGGASYGYAPAAGYDPGVTALRIAPQGMMAANSSFTVRFRARIK